MKITDMDVTPVAIADPPLLNAAGLHAPFALRTVVEITTDDGLSGLGEVPGGAQITAALEAARDLVVGRDPFHLNALQQDLMEHFGQPREARGQVPWDRRRLMHVYSAIEVACLDIIGKALGRPVCDLLGGPVRDRVPFSGYLFFKYEGAGGELGFGTDPHATGWSAARRRAALDPEGIVAQAKAMCAEFGFRSLKLKGERDDEAAMQQVQPGWRFRETRW